MSVSHIQGKHCGSGEGKDYFLESGSQEVFSAVLFKVILKTIKSTFIFLN